MGTFIATWNPKKSELSPQDLAAAIKATSGGKVWSDAWSMGARTRGIEPGDRIFLLRQNIDRGLIASGVAASDVYLAEKWDGSGADAPYVDVEWDRVLDPADRLPTEVLQVLVPGVAWKYLQASGAEVDASSVADLEAAWRDHLAAVTGSVGAGGFSPGYEDGEEEAGEGRLLYRLHRQRERDPRLAKKKKDSVRKKTGKLACEACGFDFAAIYGQLGDNFIECHHTRPLAQFGAGTTKSSDLALLCSNCHRMVHRNRQRALSVGELKAILAAP